MKLIKGLPDKTLLNRIHRFSRLDGAAQRGLGYYLLDFDERRLYPKYGFSSTFHFALMRLQIPCRGGPACPPAPADRPGPRGASPD